jgi:hypothetical protein
VTGVSEEVKTSGLVGIYEDASKGGWRTSRDGKGGIGTPKGLGRNPARRTIILHESVECCRRAKGRWRDEQGAVLPCTRHLHSEGER